MRSGSSVSLAARTAIALTGLALAACGQSAPSAANPTSSPPTNSPASTKAACTVEAVMVPIRATFDAAGNHATVGVHSGDLKCASGIARISVFIGPVNAPANGPQGTDHLVLLEDHAGRWVIANDKLCTSAGYPSKPIPPELGIVCGFQ